MNEHILFDGASDGGWQWTHMLRSAATEAALLADGEIPKAAALALLEENTLPRATQIHDGTLLILRGVNLAPGAKPEDMISLRLWITTRRIISTEIRRLTETDEIIDEFESGEAPDSTGKFVLDLIERLRAAAEPVLEKIDDRVSGLETLVAKSGRKAGLRERVGLGSVRQNAILLHRYIGPQAQALDALVRAAPDWLSDPNAVREEAEAFRRISADLDAMRQRAQLVAEEIRLAATERTNAIMMTLSMVAVVFMPVTFLTGLLGVNLTGIPFHSEPWVFWVFCGILGGVGLLSLWLALRLLR